MAASMEGDCRDATAIGYHAELTGRVEFKKTFSHPSQLLTLLLLLHKLLVSLPCPLPFYIKQVLSAAVNIN